MEKRGANPGVTYLNGINTTTDYRVTVNVERYSEMLSSFEIAPEVISDLNVALYPESILHCYGKASCNPRNKLLDIPVFGIDVYVGSHIDKFRFVSEENRWERIHAELVGTMAHEGRHIKDYASYINNWNRGALRLGGSLMIGAGMLIFRGSMPRFVNLTVTSGVGALLVDSARNFFAARNTLNASESHARQDEMNLDVTQWRDIVEIGKA